MRCWAVCVFILVWIGCHGGELWLVSQEFVKFGKGEAYVKYKRELLEGFWKGGREQVFTYVEREGIDFLYLMPVGDFGGLGEYVEKWSKYKGGLGAKLLAFQSTLNFVVDGLYEFLPLCSYVPKGSVSLLKTGAMRYFIYAVVPTGMGDFENALESIAKKTKAGCFRVWRATVSGDMPRYLVAIFADSEKGLEGLSQELNFGRTSLKQILRSQNENSYILRADLSFSSK